MSRGANAMKGVNIEKNILKKILSKLKKLKS